MLSKLSTFFWFHSVNNNSFCFRVIYSFTRSLLSFSWDFYILVKGGNLTKWQTRHWIKSSLSFYSLVLLPLKKHCVGVNWLTIYCYNPREECISSKAITGHALINSRIIFTDIFYLKNFTRRQSHGRIRYYKPCDIWGRISSGITGQFQVTGFVHRFLRWSSMYTWGNCKVVEQIAVSIFWTIGLNIEQI